MHKKIKMKIIFSLINKKLTNVPQRFTTNIKKKKGLEKQERELKVKVHCLIDIMSITTESLKTRQTLT